jgi:cobalt-zinc-cadmium efflux system protein
MASNPAHRHAAKHGHGHGHAHDDHDHKHDGHEHDDHGHHHDHEKKSLSPEGREALDHDHGGHGHHHDHEQKSLSPEGREAHDHDHGGHGHHHDHEKKSLSPEGREAHDHDHGGHGHHHHDLKAVGKQALLVALVLNGLFLVVEGGVGLVTGSLALLSDATHMLSDVAGLIVAFAAATMGARKKSGRATFGLGRVAVLGGFINGVLALVASVVIVFEAVERFLAPPPVPGLPVLVTAAIGLVVNLASAWWLHRSGDKGVNMRGALVHMLGDALGSVAAIVAGAVILLGGPVVVDPVASIVVALIVGASAVPLLRDVISILLERAPPGIDVDAVTATLRGVPAVHEVTGFHAWCLDDGATLASLVLTTAERDLHTLAHVADDVRALMRERHQVQHLTLEWRPVDHARDCCADPIADAHGAHAHAVHHDVNEPHAPEGETHAHRHQPAP